MSVYSEFIKILGGQMKTFSPVMDWSSHFRYSLRREEVWKPVYLETYLRKSQKGKTALNPCVFCLWFLSWTLKSQILRVTFSNGMHMQEGRSFLWEDHDRRPCSEDKLLVFLKAPTKPGKTHKDVEYPNVMKPSLMNEFGKGQPPSRCCWAFSQLFRYLLPVFYPHPCDLLLLSMDAWRGNARFLLWMKHKHTTCHWERFFGMAFVYSARSQNKITRHPLSALDTFITCWKPRCLPQQRWVPSAHSLEQQHEHRVQTHQQLVGSVSERRGDAWEEEGAAQKMRTPCGDHPRDSFSLLWTREAPDWKALLISAETNQQLRQGLDQELV